MTENFGTWQPSGAEKTWKVTRNVVWDLHRTPNIANPANKETIMMISNSNDQDFTTYNVMRACFAHWSNGIIRDPHGLGGPGQNIARNNSNYNETLDWVRAAGRGIAVNRTSYYYNKTIWSYDGETDWQDLRHNREVGNWMEMEDFKYNNRNSDFYGKNYQLYATEDYVDPSDPSKVLVRKGDILCSDTIRSWYPTPLYQLYILDTPNEENQGANQFQGASGKGANGDMYLFRLAETYLLRAEARLYQGNPTGAAEDVNAVRRRANAKKMFRWSTLATSCLSVPASSISRSSVRPRWCASAGVSHVAALPTSGATSTTSPHGTSRKVPTSMAVATGIAAAPPTTCSTILTARDSRVARPSSTRLTSTTSSGLFPTRPSQPTTRVSCARTMATTATTTASPCGPTGKEDRS